MCSHYRTLTVERLSANNSVNFIFLHQKTISFLASRQHSQTFLTLPVLELSLRIIPIGKIRVRSSSEMAFVTNLEVAFAES